MAKKEGEPENILSTQSSPSIYRIRKGNSTPIFPKDRQLMEEVVNLAPCSAGKVWLAGATAEAGQPTSRCSESLDGVTERDKRRVIWPPDAAEPEKDSEEDCRSGTSEGRGT